LIDIRNSFRQAVALYQLGKLVDAQDVCTTILQRQADHFDALHLSAIICLQTSNTERGIELIRKAIAINPKVAIAYSNLGNGLRNLGRQDEALHAYEKALSLDPNNPIIHNNLGNALLDLHRPTEAIACYDVAIQLNPDYAEAYNNRGVALATLDNPGDAIASYEQAIALMPAYAEAYKNRGNSLFKLQHFAEALNSIDKALSLRPTYANAWLCRGHVLRELNRHEEALAAFDKAIAFEPDQVEAWLARGHAFQQLRRYSEALGCYDKVFLIKPDLEGIEGERLKIKMNLCDWTTFKSDFEHLITSVKKGRLSVEPFTLLGLSDSPDDHLQCARSWIEKQYPSSATPLWHGQIYQHDKIRIGYISADFRQHAVADLIVETLELHDRKTFEITGLSLGPDDCSEMRKRLILAFDKFIDCRSLGDAEIAHNVRESEVDLLIDLGGFTQYSRLNVLALRSAPIQVNYLGYPGTMGADYFDYIIGDRTTLAPAHEKYYSEKLVRLPYSWQPTDRKRLISNTALTRADFNLPQSAFVFCCFNKTYKLLPDVFDCWMRVLACVDDSVLWLMEDNPVASLNIRKEAAFRGVSPNRIRFAKRLPAIADHLARHRLADLFLDTLPYNAITTATDALWAGLPILTQIGGTFGGRVGASLLNAIGLTELITTTRDEYEKMAIDLATNRERLAAMTAKLAANRPTMPLFDTPLFTRSLEAAYKTMYERYQRGLPSDHIDVPR
jgi:protein O-GlcNAc transferase